MNLKVEWHSHASNDASGLGSNYSAQFASIVIFLSSNFVHVLQLHNCNCRHLCLRCISCFRTSQSSIDNLVLCLYYHDIINTIVSCACPAKKDGKKCAVKCDNLHKIILELAQKIKLQKIPRIVIFQTWLAK